MKPHTPTPWKVATNPGAPQNAPAFPSIVDCSGLPNGEDIVAMPLGNSEEVKANAAFIVHCVNTHADNLQSITDFSDALNGLLAWADTMRVAHVHPFMSDSALDKARAVLSKAQKLS